MKILQVISSFPPAYSYGGAPKTAYEISKELVKKGHKVTVYTTDVNDSEFRLDFKENPIFVDDIEIHHFKNLSNKLAYMNFPIAPSMARALKKNIHNFDIVHLHDYRSFQAILVHHYSKKNKIPYIIQPHGSALNIMGMFWFKKLFDKLWGNSILRESSKVIALTNAEKDILKNLGINESDIQVIPNGINLSDYENLPQKGIFRTKYGIRPNEKLILFLGRLHKIKGIELLIESFVELSKDDNDIKLVIVGPDGGFLSDIMKLIKRTGIGNKVIVTGPLYGKKKLEAFVDADIYVLPSFYETFPNTVIESCVCGTPVIITDRCGISDIVKDKVGLVVEYEKTSLINGLTELLRDNTLKKYFNKNCKGFVLEKFSLTDVIIKLEEIYSYFINC